MKQAGEHRRGQGPQQRRLLQPIRKPVQRQDVD